MDHSTTILVLLGIAVMGGYFAFHALSEKIDRLHHEVADLTKDVAKVEILAERTHVAAKTINAGVHEVYHDMKR